MITSVDDNLCLGPSLLDRTNGSPQDTLAAAASIAEGMEESNDAIPISIFPLPLVPLLRARRCTVRFIFISKTRLAVLGSAYYQGTTPIGFPFQVPAGARPQGPDEGVEQYGYDVPQRNGGEGTDADGSTRDQ